MVVVECHSNDVAPLELCVFVDNARSVSAVYKTNEDVTWNSSERVLCGTTTRVELIELGLRCSQRYLVLLEGEVGVSQFLNVVGVDAILGFGEIPINGNPILLGAEQRRAELECLPSGGEELALELA